VGSVLSYATIGDFTNCADGNECFMAGPCKISDNVKYGTPVI